MSHYSLNFEIIDICNLRCSMCDIWKNTHKNTLHPQDISSILHSFQGMPLDITFTWGEPLLHENIRDLLHEVYAAGYMLNTLSTNGILEQKMLTFLSYFSQYWWKVPDIHISIDGFGETHDRQRWKNGAFIQTLRTIQSIQKHSPDVKIKLKYTITPWNVFDIRKVYSLAKRLEIDILFKPVHNDQFYTNRLNTLDELPASTREIAMTLLEPILDQKNPYNSHLLHYLRTQTLPFICKTTERSLFIMANGDIFPCTQYASIGNIRHTPFTEIFQNHAHQELNQYVRENRCQKCFSPHGSYKTLI